MYNSRKDLMKILSHADFAKLCNAIKYFPECNQNFVKGGIYFSLLSSSRAIKRQKKYLNELESCLEKINTRTYHNFKMDQNYYKRYPMYTKGNDTRKTFSYLSKRQYKQMRFVSFPCLKIDMTDIIPISR